MKFGALHHKNDVKRLYLPLGKDGSGLIGCKIYIKSEENNLVWYTRNCKKKLIMGMQQTKILNCDSLKQKKSTKQEKQNKLKNRWKYMAFYLKEMPQTTDKNKTWK